MSPAVTIVIISNKYSRIFLKSLTDIFNKMVAFIFAADSIFEASYLGGFPVLM